MLCHIFTGKIESVKKRSQKRIKTKFQTLKHRQSESFKRFVIFSFAKSFYMATLFISNDRMK